MNTPPKSPSHRRVVVIAGACAVLASAVTPVSAATPRAKTHLKKPAAEAQRGGGGGLLSLERAIAAALRP